MILTHVENILKAFQIEPKPLDRLIDAYYKRHRGLGPKERGIISDAVFGVARFKRRLEGILKSAGISRPTNLQLACAYLLWKGAPESLRPELQTIIDGPLNFEVSAAVFPGGPAAYYSFPDFLYTQLVQWKGKESAAAEALALNETAPLVIRVNTLKTNRERLQKELEEEGIASRPTKFSPFGLILQKRINLSSLHLFKEGHFEVQEEASQLIGFLVGARKGELIGDVCAGSGGKTLLLSMLMGNTGRIIASDIDLKKLGQLKKRARQAGITNLRMVKPEEIISEFREKMDAVLIDAPCSGTGTLRRNPDLKWRLGEEDLRHYISTQKDLLGRCSKAVKKGGRLIYATCSILPSENEEVVKWFLEGRPWEIVRVEQFLKVPESEKFITPEGYFRTDPAKMKLDGFFGCILRRI